MPSLPRPIPASFSRARSARDSMPGLALGCGIFALLGCEPDEGASPGSSSTDAGSTAATATTPDSPSATDESSDATPSSATTDPDPSATSTGELASTDVTTGELASRTFLLVLSQCT